MFPQEAPGGKATQAVSPSLWASNKAWVPSSHTTLPLPSRDLVSKAPGCLAAPAFQANRLSRTREANVITSLLCTCWRLFPHPQGAGFPAQPLPVPSCPVWPPGQGPHQDPFVREVLQFAVSGRVKDHREGLMWRLHVPELHLILRRKVGHGWSQLPPRAVHRSCLVGGGRGKDRGLMPTDEGRGCRLIEGMHVPRVTKPRVREKMDMTLGLSPGWAGTG